MPHRTSPRPRDRAAVTMTVTADSLVAADFRPRARTRRPDRHRGRPPGPYRRLLAVPGARAFTAGNLVARLPQG
ncbi:MFS transporter, partial [Streptomyces sp. TRM76130]|nr:MFS transporter [Streptomyces sp. TRM76130]